MPVHLRAMPRQSVESRSARCCLLHLKSIVHAIGTFLAPMVNLQPPAGQAPQRKKKGSAHRKEPWGLGAETLHAKG